MSNIEKPAEAALSAASAGFRRVKR